MVFNRGRIDDLILNFDRIRDTATNFIRGNPIIAGGIGLGAPLALIGIAQVGRRVTRRKTKRRVSRKRRKTATRKKARIPGKRRKTHRSPRHKGHKRVSFTTAQGQKVSFLVRKKGSVSHRRKKRKSR